MDDATAFAIGLAEAVSPDEADLAPALVDAAARGGASWDRLVAPRAASPVLGGVIGEVGPGDLVLVFDAIRQVVSYLTPICAFGGSVLTLLIHWKTLREKRAAPQAASAPAAEDAAVGQVAEAIRGLTDALAAKGIERGRSEALAQGVVEAIGRDATKARAFLERVRGAL